MLILGKIYQERQGKEQETVCNYEVDHVYPGLSPSLEFAAEDPEGNHVQWDPQREHWDVDYKLKECNAVLHVVIISAVLHVGLSLLLVGLSGWSNPQKGCSVDAGVVAGERMCQGRGYQCGMLLHAGHSRFRACCRQLKHSNELLFPKRVSFITYLLGQSCLWCPLLFYSHQLDALPSSLSTQTAPPPRMSRKPQQLKFNVFSSGKTNHF